MLQKPEGFILKTISIYYSVWQNFIPKLNYRLPSFTAGTKEASKSKRYSNALRLQALGV